LEWLNYHHFLSYDTVAKDGDVPRAAQVLRLAQPTLSGQIRKLEHVLDEEGEGKQDCSPPWPRSPSTG
jgi:LysR family transcriptional activator of nhaA